MTRFCRDQIAHYKIPRYVRFVDAFPMTVTGKIQKFLIREQMVAELAKHSAQSIEIVSSPKRVVGNGSGGGT